MRLGKSLIGNSVFCIVDGRKLGQVKDLYLDDDLTSVVGIYLGREGLLRPTPRFIERADVALFGMEVVLTKETAPIYGGEEAPEPPGWVRLAELEGRPVQTPGGTKVGKVGDVALDEEARITGVSLTSLSVRGPVAEAEAVARKALVDVGAADGVMTIDLAEAEGATLEIDPDLLFSGFAPREAPMEMEVPEEEEAPLPGQAPEEEPEIPQEPDCVD
ncbi:MAG: PRC-barrel domain-containing protein [Chloroflexota bacterium]|nr:PRC-barrel domain-containing protein [Chloroflexota bacterium]